MIRKISTLLFLILWATPVFAQTIPCTIEYDQQWNLIEDTCVTNNTGYCSSPGGQFRTPKKNGGWCFKTQGNLRGSEVFDRPASAVQEKPKSAWVSALTAWRTKPNNSDEEPTQQCKKRNWLGACLDPVIMYVATQQALKNQAFTIPPTSQVIMPCTKEKEDSKKKGLDCAAPAEEKWKTDANGHKYTVCEENKPRTAGQCACPQPAPAGTPENQKYSYCASDPNFKCNDTPS